MSFSVTDLCIGCGACLRVCPVGAISGEKKEQHSIDARLCIECGACGRVCPKSAILDTGGRPVPRLKRGLWLKPVIIVERCFACENCVAACPAGALSMKAEDLPLGQNYAVLRYPEKCVSCLWCFENCQFDAIRMEASDESDKGNVE